MVSMPAVWRGQYSAYRLFAGFLLIAVLAPTPLFWGIYFALASGGSEALSYFTFFLAPAAMLVFLLPLAVWFGVGTFRAAKTAGRPGTVLRMLVACAILWVPSMAFWVFTELSAWSYMLAGNP